MANYCYYDVRVKGSKKACIMVYYSMPCSDDKLIREQKETKDGYFLSFRGQCKWSVNYDVKDSMEEINVNQMSEAQIQHKGQDYWYNSLRAKSEVLKCELMVHYWSSESGFDQFDHYKNGEVLKRRKIEIGYGDADEYACEGANVFDWDKLEFVGHEGEYDESVDGEEKAMQFLEKLKSFNASFAAGADEPEELKKVLDELVDNIGYLNVEFGDEKCDSAIGDTGFDMYDWTFTEGKRKAYGDWSIAIPDGFEIVSSKEDRPFEMIPHGMKKKSVDDIPVRLLPSSEANIVGDFPWMYHPYTRAALAEKFAILTANEAMYAYELHRRSCRSSFRISAHVYLLTKPSTGITIIWHLSWARKKNECSECKLNILRIRRIKILKNR